MVKYPEYKSVIGDIVKKLLGLLSIKNITSSVNKEINKKYSKGLDDMGLELGIKFDKFPERLDFLKEFTFDNIKGMTNDISEKLRKELTMSIAKGESIPDLKKRISSIMDVADSRAITIARTEANRAENFGRLDAAQQSGLKLEKWISITKDDRTSKISLAMDSKYGSPDKAIPLNENFSVIVNGKVFEGPAPPFHPNDRDVVIIKQSDNKKSFKVNSSLDRKIMKKNNELAAHKKHLRDLEVQIKKRELQILDEKEKAIQRKNVLINSLEQEMHG